MSTTNWYIDIEEEWKDSADTITHIHAFSVGPFEFENNAVMSVQDFLNHVNNKFAEAAYPNDEPETGGTYAVYEIAATAVLPGRANATATHNANNFLIKYRIFSNSHGAPAAWGEPSSFKIQFRDGIHGYMEPESYVGGPTPRGDIYWQNRFSIPAAVLDYSEQIVQMMDAPPLSPNVNIIPYTGVNNKLLLWLNSNTGEFLATPIAIKDADAARIAMHYNSQTGASITAADIALEAEPGETAFPNGNIRLLFRNDDPITKYEVFRINTKPTSYADFNTAANPHIVTSGRVTSRKKTSGGSFIDTVEPNTKYYYCFRAVDVHNNFSNPTHVFEAELVDNDGQVYLVLKTIMFEVDVTGVNSKAGKRFLYIEPSARNLNIAAMPPSGSYVGDNPGGTFLASTGDRCWNQTFKVRLTSKKSNKKIDLNIAFKNTGVINP